MTPHTILVADNIKDFRITVVDYLKRKGYKVVEAETIGEAKDILTKGEVDAAVMDIRMINEDDPADISGLTLASEVAPQIPKIILTAYPRPDLVRAAFRQVDGKLPVAVDFFDKGEGLPALLTSLEKILPLRDVFVIHGHDDKARLEVENFLRKVYLKPVVLKDQPIIGGLLLERFEKASATSFAVVIITPDDQCVLKNDGDKLELRARQNVILEMGYFMGKLGRSRVCMLYEEGVVLPSDLHGFTWVKLDREGAWKLYLARELRMAGIYVDLLDV
jgi:CheY-like chemotaxis protein